MNKPLTYSIGPTSSGFVVSIRGRFLSIFPTTSTRAGNGARTFRLGPVSVQIGNVSTLKRPARVRALAAAPEPTIVAREPQLPGLGDV